MNSFFALTTRGLEQVGAAEIAEIPGVTVIETGYRRVAARIEESPGQLLNLRTVDDLYVYIGTWQGVGHTRDMLGVIEQWSEQLDLTTAAQVCATVRSMSPQPLFSVTASFVGKRNYSTDEIKNVVANGIYASQGWTYTGNDREADLNLRVFIEHEIAYVGLRLGKSPLHERAYKQVQRAGSLKPSVASAMLRLVDVKPGMRLLDPSCGVGTILIEGATIGAIAQGGDIDPEAVAASRANADAAGFVIKVSEWDARKLPLEDQSVERVVTNLPWGKQIKIDDDLGWFYRELCAEMERVLMPAGRVAILTSTPHLLQFDQLRLKDTIEISLFGQTPTIHLYVVS
jgi:tRNA (guanine6-N2)-methyltransferase